MTNQHPITPPPELVQQWINEEDGLTAGHIATQAARWGADQQLKLDAEQIAQAYQKGADQELDACLLCLRNSGYEKIAQCLHDDRRPEPPSLKEQALEALGADGYSMLAGKRLEPVQLKIIRRALEALPND